MPIPNWAGKCPPGWVRPRVQGRRSHETKVFDFCLAQSHLSINGSSLFHLPVLRKTTMTKRVQNAKRIENIIESPESPMHFVPKHRWPPSLVAPHQFGAVPDRFGAAKTTSLLESISFLQVNLSEFGVSDHSGSWGGWIAGGWIVSIICIWFVYVWMDVWMNVWMYGCMYIISYKYI